MMKEREIECAKRLLERGVACAIVREALEDLIERAEIEEIILNEAGECRAEDPTECPKHGFKSNLERRRERDEAVMKEYRESNDHPSADDVASGEIPIKEALKKGFEAEFGGQKLVFFTKTLREKYEERKFEPGRLGYIQEAVKQRKAFQIRYHNGEQIAMIQQGKSVKDERPLVVIADQKTGVVQSVMPTENRYSKKKFKKTLLRR